MRFRIVTAVLGAAACIIGLGVSATAASASSVSKAAVALPQSIIPNGGYILPEFDNRLTVTTHGTGNQLTVEGNGTGTRFYSTDATGGGQKFHVSGGSNCWERDGTAINAQPCAAGNGDQVFNIGGGSGTDNWFIYGSNGDKVIIFSDNAGKPLWTSSNPPFGSLARWLIG